MPRDRERRATVADKPLVNFAALTAAGQTKAQSAQTEKEAKRLEELRAQAKEGNRFAKKELTRIAKRERDRTNKENRRESADQLGLGRDAQKEPKGKNKETQQKKNTEELMARLNETGKGPAARNAARELLDRLGEGSGRKPQGVAVGRDQVTGKQIFDTKVGSTYFGDGKAQVVARLKELVGRSYSGSKERQGVFNVKRDAVTGRRTAEYVKPKKGAGRAGRSTFSQGPKRPVGRPRKSKPQ